jgi:hypothetical protein
MLRRNAASRYDVAIDVAKLYRRNDLVQKYQKVIDDNHAYAIEHGEDMIE